MELYVKGPMYPDLFDGETPIMVPAKKIAGALADDVMHPDLFDGETPIVCVEPLDWEPDHT